MQNLLFKILIFTVIIFGISCTPRNPDAAEEFIVNGLKVIVKPNRANEIVDVQLYLLGGSLNISEQTQGIEPLIFESALKGSKNYPKEKLNTILDRTAARISTNSGMDYTTMSLHCLNRYFDETWDVFTDIIMNPTFDEHEVELVRDRLLVDIRQRQDDPDSYLRELAVNLFYKEHPYRLDPDGTEASMSKISIEQMKNHLCQVVPLPNHDTDWIRMMDGTMRNQQIWRKDPELTEWLYNDRLDGFSHLMANVSDDDDELQEILERFRSSIKPAMIKLKRLISELDK